MMYLFVMELTLVRGVYFKTFAMYIWVTIVFATVLKNKKWFQQSSSKTLGSYLIAVLMDSECPLFVLSISAATNSKSFVIVKVSLKEKFIF